MFIRSLSQSRVWSRAPQLLALALLSAIIAASIAGCATSTVVVNGTPNATSAATSVATSAATSATTSTATTCAQVPGFAQAGPAPHAGAVFGSIPFPDPSHSLYTDLNVVFNGGAGLFSISYMSVCTPNTTANAVRSHFATNAPNTAWKQSSTYPYDGGYQAPCGDPYCWSRVPSSPNFLSLEKVTDVGNGLVTYGIRLASPPSNPDCSNIVPGGGSGTIEFFWSQQPPVPVPPLTVEGMGSGHGVGGKTVYSQEMCGPGTATSVKTFMSGELAKLGYSATNQSLCGTTGWVVKGSLAIAWTVSDPTNWSLSYCQ